MDSKASSDSLLNLFLKKCGDFIYPPLCLYCQAFRESRHKQLCQACFNSLELLDPLERCRNCFVFLEDPSLKICLKCRASLPSYHNACAAFLYEGAAAALVKAMKYSNQPYLADGIASLMALQFHQMQWPLPDIIVPVPISLGRLFVRGYNQSLLLGQNLGRILKVPVRNLLKRRLGDHSQAGLSSKQRLSLNVSTFYLKKSSAIRDLRILLVDDVMTTGSTINACSLALIEGFPAEIYVIAACRTD